MNQQPHSNSITYGKSVSGNYVYFSLRRYYFFNSLGKRTVNPKQEEVANQKARKKLLEKRKALVERKGRKGKER